MLDTVAAADRPEEMPLVEVANGRVFRLRRVTATTATEAAERSDWYRRQAQRLADAMAQSPTSRRRHGAR